MSDMFGDRLKAAVERTGAPICVGIDPIPELIPAAIRAKLGRTSTGHEADLDAVFDFTLAVLRTVAGHVPIVKFQSAYFERFLWDGVEAYYSLVQEARDLGLLVIGDIKRGDIGTTATAYAQAHLTGPPGPDPDDDEVAFPDAITVNPMLGLDTLEPFLEPARTLGKGLFVLVRTSNPGSADLQDVKLEDGRTWSEMLADRLAVIAAREGLVGSGGFSNVGAVVGATQPHIMASLRKRLPQSWFLLPGYGAQGATAEMTRAAFVDGRGAIVSASRSILYAHRDPKYAGLSDWKECTLKATLDMKAELAAVLS